jgi:hypothetical protein
MAATFAALMAAAFWTGSVQQLGGASFVRFSILSLAVPFVISACSACLLRWRTPNTVTVLRTLELVITGTVAAAILWGMTRPEWYGLLEHGPATASPREFSAFRGAYTESTSLRWFALLVGYGAVIPNTWRRCTAVVTVLALSPLVLFALFSLWIRPLPTDVAVTVFSVLALWIAVAVTVVVFTAYRIEVLGQQAAEAGKLGQYLLKQRLGAGGMGEVYLAEHVLLRRPCAVKLIRPERASEPAYVQRFEREVRLTATLTHPNTIQVFDYGRTDDDTFYYVMEYLKGFIARADGEPPRSAAGRTGNLLSPSGVRRSARSPCDRAVAQGHQAGERSRLRAWRRARCDQAPRFRPGAALDRSR